MKKWLLIDGFNLIFRSFYAVKELSRSDGFPTNAIHGWLRTWLKLQETLEPDHCIAIFDKGGSHFRKELHPTYKAHRSETPEALLPQIPIIQSLTEKLGTQCITQEGIEADDIIGTLAQQLSAQGEQVYILSSDKDLAQCVTNNVTQILPPPTVNPKLGWRHMTPAAVEEKFKVTPAQIVDYLSLIGDTADNIPGLPGVGPKTAAKWIEQYKTLDTIIDKALYIEPKRFQLVIPEHAEQLKINEQLITLQTVSQMPPLAAPAVQLESLLEALQELEMVRMHTDIRNYFTHTASI